MGSTVIRTRREEPALYMVWSSVIEEPLCVSDDRADLIAFLYKLDDRKPERIPESERPETRVARADELGTSALWGNPRADSWDDEAGTIYRQQGHLRRDRYHAFAERILETGDFSVDVADLLEPFGGDE